MNNSLAIPTDFYDAGIPDQHKECLYALFLTDPQDDLAEIRTTKGDRVDGTCEWILTQRQYTSWLVEGSAQLLWLSGAPGIGKTMISSFLVKELATIAERSRHMTLAYYFCDDKTQERRTAMTVLRGLLLQILRQRPVLFKHIQTSFDMSGNRLFTNFHALWRIFIAIVNDPEVGELCCLVDALDECERDSRELFLVEFTRLYCSQKSKSPLVKFIITSRRENDIVESLSAVSPPIRHIQVDSGKVNDDVSKFVDTRVNDLSRRKGYDAELQNEIKTALKNKAEGTFLYVSLVLSILAKTWLRSQVRRKLQKLPEDLNKLYDKILSQIDRDCEEIAIFVFRWVAVARRPLTVKELAMARALSTPERKTDALTPDDFAAQFEDIYRCCEPFVYLDTKRGTINLVHQSAKDYLLGEYLQAKEGVSQYHIVQDSSNLLMFRTCWKFLSCEEFGQGTMLFKDDANHNLLLEDHSEEFDDEHFFLQYARTQWLEHAFAASPVLATDSMFWNQNLAESPTLRDVLLLGAAAEGEYAIVQRLLENGAQMDSRDEDGMTTLSLASREGHEKVVKLLLEWSKAWIDSPNIGGQIQLHETAEAGHTALVKSLSRRDDIGPNFQDKYGRTPLLWAAQNGHEAVVRLLLSREDIEVNSQDKDRNTPLLWAGEYGEEGVVRMLISREEIEVNSPDDYGDTPLSSAARYGYERVVKLLLSHEDIAVNSQNKDGRTPLLWAVEYGYEGVIRLLLSRDDIDVNSRDGDGWTALMWAVIEKREAMVRLLLSRNDIDVNIRDDDGWTALMVAAENGYEEMVRLLLSRSDIEVLPQDLERVRSWATEDYDPFMELLEQKLSELNEAAAE